jgi:hypothetical protein
MPAASVIRPIYQLISAQRRAGGARYQTGGQRPAADSEKLTVSRYHWPSFTYQGIIILQHFRISFIVTLICLSLAFWWGFHFDSSVQTGIKLLMIAAILAVMEVSLSFDNAVVNASVLKTWDHYWRTIFLTVGMLVAVFGMRLVFPLAIVAFTTDLSMVESGQLALNNPVEYSKLLLSHHAEVAAFGGMFLMLVFLSFIFDAEKDIHWLHWIEEKLAALGKVDAVAIFVALVALLLALSLVHEHETFKVLMAGVWGIVVFLGVNVLSAFLEDEEEHDPTVGELVKRGSIGGFLYLEVLDASFSFDGVIGAFAITNDVIIIMLGLTIGAMFVRSLTIFLVEKGTLDAYIFLEHGAHYAIGALSVIMLLSLKYEVPELVTGLIGVAFIGWSVLSSIRHSKAQAA